MANPTLREVALDPRWLPHTFDVSGSMLTSVFVPRDRRADLMFLSDEHFDGQFPKATFPASAIADAAADCPQAPLHFIFHSAFCGSTLMARAFDVPAHALKEPDILINMANRFIRSDDRSNRERLALILRLLARPFELGEAIVVKPSNVANRLALPILESRPEARAVLLYSDVRPLLRSILSRGLWGRIWGRRIFHSAIGWTSLDFGYSPEETFVLTDLQALALGWLIQVHHFDEIRRRMGDRVMLVDSADFLADPGNILRRISRLFKLDMNSSALEKIVQGPIFARHSKFSERGYGQAERAADQNAAQAAHQEELEMVVKWVEAVAAHLHVDLTPAASPLARAV